MTLTSYTWEVTASPPIMPQSSIGTTRPAATTGFLVFLRFDTSISGTLGEQIVCNGANGTAPHADSRAFVFDRAGHLLNGNDGGIHRLKNPGDASAREWEALSGDLQITEVHKIAYDPVNDVILVGTQDNGSSQQLEPGGLLWEQTRGGDGNAQAVSVKVDSDGEVTVFRYSLGNTLNSFTRQEYNAENEKQDRDSVNLGRSVNGTSLRGLAKRDRFSNGFVTMPVVVNAVNPDRLLVGFHGVYETRNNGDRVIRSVRRPTGPNPIQP